MQEGLRTEVTRIIVLGLFLLLFGSINGFPYSTLLIGGAAYMIFTLVKINKLYAWLAKESDDMPPEAGGVWGDISDYLYRLRKRMEQSQKNYAGLALRIRQITTALDDGMLLLNADHSLDWWNPTATELLKLRETDKGENIANLIRHPQFISFINRDSFEQPLELNSPFDPHRIFQFSAGTFGRGEIVLVVRDITRLRNLEEMRKEFVANISHELRTPLTVLTGYIETLQGDQANLPPHWQRALLQMEQQTARLNSLAEDLVMLSRLESAQTPIQRLPVNLNPLLANIVEGQRVLCSDDHTLALKCEPDLVLFGNGKELNSAFSNLIVNAIKHNPKGCDISVKARRTTRGISVRVADNGTGIDPKHLPRLTERFYRVDDSRATISGGTGLGLAIVKHVLGRHNGTLKIRSTLGKGTIFTCEFNTETNILNTPAKNVDAHENSL